MTAAPVGRYPCDPQALLVASNSEWIDDLPADWALPTTVRRFQFDTVNVADLALSTAFSRWAHS